MCPLFSAIPIGGQFVEVFSVCDELVTKIVPVEADGKTYNAQRSGGKLVYMADWEPVLLRPPSLSNFWQCPRCDEWIHDTWVKCLYC